MMSGWKRLIGQYSVVDVTKRRKHITTNSVHTTMYNMSKVLDVPARRGKYGEELAMYNDQVAHNALPEQDGASSYSEI